MKYKITYTKRFEKRLKKLSAIEKKQIKAKVELLADNPLHPSLRTKRIQGTDHLFECSVNMDITVRPNIQEGTIESGGFSVRTADLKNGFGGTLLRTLFPDSVFENTLENS